MSNISNFLQSVTVLDTETTHLLPEQAEVVEVAGAVFDGQSWAATNLLLNAKNGIPPEASAKNNIGPRDIKDQPYWDQSESKIKDLLHWDHSTYFVAHNAAYDRTVIKTAWAAMGNAQDVAVCEDQSRWICTLRLSKQILDHNFPNIQYSLNYLRFLLDLDLPQFHNVHRADADAVTCAMLLQALVGYAIELGLVTDAPDLGEQLAKLCWGPIAVKTWPFGKHRGALLADIPNDYYVWALKNVNSLQAGNSDYDPDLAESVKQLLEQRRRKS